MAARLPTYERQGSELTTKIALKRSKLPPSVEVAGLQLIDGTTCAGIGSMSLSWWLEEVRAGRAPAPAIRQSRCTRWRHVDVLNYWRGRLEQAADDTRAAEFVIVRAKSASDAARKKRAGAKHHSGDA